MRLVTRLTCLGVRFAFAIAVAAAPSIAAGQAEDSLLSKIVDLPVPDSPAAAAISGTADNVLRPATPQDFAASLLSLVDRSGHMKPGISIEVMPVYLAFSGRNPPWAGGSDVGEVLATSTISFASGLSETEGERSKRMALGLRFTPWDPEDPRRNANFGPCLKLIELPRRASESDGSLGKDAAAQLEKCYALSRWNRSNWTVALAQAWRDRGVDRADFSRDSRSLWTNLAYGFDQCSGRCKRLYEGAQVSLQLRMTRNELDTEKTTTSRTVELDRDSATARVRFGSPTANVSLAATFERRKWNDGSPRQNARIFAGGADFKIDALQLLGKPWVSVEFGGEGGDKDGKHAAFTFVSMKWAFNKEPRFGN